ncbi:rod shape-determining protein MreD [Nocardioides sp. zg-536]|uniref:Rod shape-determining protein MreD n=1 Tax=Nocardioides faecalis TaxID=2803858 RepID=A0A938Y4Y8_9ACTN|nr:rod shape-determining protein MreD [Nocardioides faecalis]MBM9459292.1 rod shape-determining protein MreD [Nocardioides faecalis]MBS4751531.1 rod shape-determining protein MreD [Nocardioides faecalis]QVI59583.1 rod shape-determining protein MreD [Nocardioides faecalis]
MRVSSSGRLVAVLLAVLLALLAQVTVLPHFAWQVRGLGVVPDLLLLVVVGVALLTDTRYATLTGFFAGLLLDLAPPADHLAGRWALALAVVGYVIGRLAHDHTTDAPQLAPEVVRRVPLPLVLAAAAGGSFVGTSVFALTGVFLDDAAAGVSDLLPVALVALLLDVLAALVVVPALAWLLRRIGTERGPAGLWARA